MEKKVERSIHATRNPAWRDHVPYISLRHPTLCIKNASVIGASIPKVCEMRTAQDAETRKAL
jgi:hypothetical protein